MMTVFDKDGNAIEPNQKFGLETPRGEITTHTSEMPTKLRIVTLAGGIIEVDVAARTPVKYTTPLEGWDLAAIEVNIFQSPPKGPRLVKD